MPRPSPATERFVALMGLLAEHPRESFSLSEIARRLGFNKATAHGMLAALTSADFLTRDDDTMTFRLGSAMVTLGQAAVGPDAKLAVLVQPELDALSQGMGVPCVVSRAIGDELVVIAGSGGGARGIPVGYRSRLAPPVGAVFMAWATDALVEQWLSRRAATPDRPRQRAELATVRERGFSVSADGGGRGRLESMLRDFEHGDLAAEERRSALVATVRELSREELEVGEIEPDRSYGVRQISVPVFDATGAVRLALQAVGPPHLTGSTLTEYARELSEAAGRLTLLIGGSAETVQATAH